MNEMQKQTLLKVVKDTVAAAIAGKPVYEPTTDDPELLAEVLYRNPPMTSSLAGAVPAQVMEPAMSPSEMSMILTPILRSFANSSS